MSDISTLGNIANNIISQMKGGDYDDIIKSLQSMKAGCGCGGNQLNGGKAKKVKSKKASKSKSKKATKVKSNKASKK